MVKKEQIKQTVFATHTLHWEILISFLINLKNYTQFFYFKTRKDFIKKGRVKDTRYLMFCMVLFQFTFVS